MDIQTHIQKETRALLEKMGFQFLHTPTVREDDGRFFVDVFVDEPRDLIGERGAHLAAFQQVVRLMAARRFDPEVRIDIDVNGYKKKRQEFIRDMAYQARRQALGGKGRVALEPMSAYDRRVIHATLASYSDVATASEGMGRDRRVVVRAIQRS